MTRIYNYCVLLQHATQYSPELHLATSWQILSGPSVVRIRIILLRHKGMHLLDITKI